MKLSGEWFREYEPESFTEVQQKLDAMTQKNRSFICLEDADVSYIQAGGYGGRFTVEVRLYHPDGSFTHYKAACPAEKPGGQATVFIGGREVSVTDTQVLSGETVRGLFARFYDAPGLDGGVAWEDMTDIFR